MRFVFRFSVLSLLVFLAYPSFAEEPGYAQLLRAGELGTQGQFRATISVLEALVQPGADTLTGANVGVAWNMLGSAHQYLGEYDQARRCYEQAINILKAAPNSPLDYASAIDNLGSVESSMNQYEAAKVLRQKARHLYEIAGNHAGISRTSSNLALMELTHGYLHAARKDMSKALSEAQLAKEPGDTLTDDDIGAMDTIQGSLAMTEQDYRAAIAAYQHAIDLWTSHHGPQYYLLGLAYPLRADALDKLGNHQQAIADMRHALAILDTSLGQSNPSYLNTQLNYARLLRETGAKEEAARIETAANAGLANARRQQCSGCTISAAGFR